MLFVNVYKFHTFKHSIGKTIANTSVHVNGGDYGDERGGFYGVLQEVVEFEYIWTTHMITYIFSSIIGNDTLSPLRIRVNLNYKIVELNKKKKRRSQNIIHLFWYSLRAFSIFTFFCEINLNSVYRNPQRLRILNSRLSM